MGRRPKSMRDALEGRLDENELDLVPRAFDIIGDIAVLDLPDELSGKRKLIGEALLETFTNIKVVVNKKSNVETEYRIKDVEAIAGEDRTVTVHKEYGCSYKLDISRAYFSPRLGTERMRVAEQVNEGERVLVMFAGIGPYAILIAKKRKPSEVVAVEINPDAVRYMRENVKLNKVNVTIVEGDAREEVPKLGEFDRIIMPLPKDAQDFLDVAVPAAKDGGIIHFYSFAHTPEELGERVKEVCSSLGCKVEVENSVQCGSYSPCLSRTCADFRVTKD
ncbi:MAG: class I SAM-dependent methyltransferase family protein [Candidatus Altiarchaeota archaeon]